MLAGPLEGRAVQVRGSGPAPSCRIGRRRPVVSAEQETKVLEESRLLAALDHLLR